MKNLKTIPILLCTIILIVFQSCSNNEDSSDNNDNNIPSESGSSYVKFSVNGSVVNGLYEIYIEDEDYNTANIGEEGYSGIYGNVYDEGDIKKTSLVYTTWGATADNYFEVKFETPAHTGPLELGEIMTPQGWIEDYPTFYMTFRFLNEDVFYDSNNDGNNDITTAMLSKTLSLTITGFEETILNNTNGVQVLAHVKGSFEGTAYFNAYSEGAPSNTQQLLHTVTGTFEYNIPLD